MSNSLPRQLNVRSGIFFPWVIALATGLEYFDNATFSFFLSHIAGGVNATPRELIWSSTAYAMASVLGILQQRWWTERIGHRRYIGGCLLLFAAGAAGSASSGSAIQLAVARGAQGYFIGPMMSACRILIQVSFTPQRRSEATRIFLTTLLLGSALGPLTGGYLIAHFGWRSLFICTGLAGAVVALLALFAVPDSGSVASHERGDAHFWPFMIFAFAQGTLQIVMQQSRFELFGASPVLLLLTAAGLLSLAWFVWHQWHHPKPLVRLHALRERTFQVGIGLYIFFYYMSNALGYLSSRFLEGGLGYPVENAGHLVGVTSLSSLIMAFAYFRYSALVTRKKWMIVSGFMLAALIGIWMVSMPSGVSESWLYFPFILRGLLLFFIALPVANVTFRIFAIEEFHHGYRFKNIVKQLTYSFATATMIALEQHRSVLHRTRLVEFVNSFNPSYQDFNDKIVYALETIGYPSSEAARLALVQIDRMVTQQANFLSALDGFYFLIGIALCGGVFAALQRQID